MLAALAALAAASVPDARAALWCALPLEVHEWGVHVFGPGGAPTAALPWPDFFHTSVGGGAPATGPAVRDLPADSGIRLLPVLHFYAPNPGRAQPIPIGLEVGFSHGAATTWFPQVDLFRAAAAAHAATTASTDDRAQLVWRRLELTSAPPRPPTPSSAAWIAAARALPALWVSGAGEAERFVFYEGDSDERAPLTLGRAAAWRPDRRAYMLTNRGPHAVHDVFVTTREGTRTFVVRADAIAPGASLEVVLEDHEVSAARVRAATVDALRAALVDPAHPASAFDPQRPFGDDCVTGRDPAIPFATAVGHALYAAEADLVLALWGDRFFARAGTTIVYREDEVALDAAMPLAIYADMTTFVVLQRAGLALWESVPLP